MARVRVRGLMLTHWKEKKKKKTLWYKRNSKSNNVWMCDDYTMHHTLTSVSFLVFHVGLDAPVNSIWCGVTVDRYFWYFASSLLCSHGNSCYIECQEAQNHLRTNRTPTLSADSPSALQQHSHTHSHTCVDDDVRLNTAEPLCHHAANTLWKPFSIIPITAGKPKWWPFM